MPEVTRAVAPPRALVVPYGLGYPMGEPGNAALQQAILRKLLALCPRTDVPLIEALSAEP